MAKINKYVYAIICQRFNENVEVCYWCFRKIGDSEIVEGQGRENLVNEMVSRCGLWYSIGGDFVFYPIIWEGLKRGYEVNTIMPENTPLQVTFKTPYGEFKIRDLQRKLPPQLNLYDIYEYYNITYVEPTAFSNDLKAEEIKSVLLFLDIIYRLLSNLCEYGLTKLTLGSDAYCKWKDTFSQKDFRSKFPQISGDKNDFLRKSYWGGKCFINPHYKSIDIIGNGYYLDRKRLYSNIAISRALPYGFPIYGKGRAKATKSYPIYIQHIRCYYTLKKGCPPIMDNEAEFPLHSFLDKRDLYFTQSELPYFFKFYNVFDVDFIDYIQFKASNKIFSSYFQQVDNDFKLPSMYKKGLKNILISKFAQKQEIINNVPYLNKNNIISLREQPIKNSLKYYLPLSIFINSYGRCVMYDIITRCGGLNKNSIFLYCDTDSAHILSDTIPSFFDVKLWSVKGHFNRAYFECQKTYIERGDNKESIKICGVPFYDFGIISKEDFPPIPKRKYVIKGIGGIYYSDKPKRIDDFTK